MSCSEKWMREYNEERPHDSLNGIIPCDYGPDTKTGKSLI
ncbi:integrase core domain-containing protein [Vibrio quintilis]